MISIDTNILLPAVETAIKHHSRAAAFLESLQSRADVAISELILLELYVLLRNPAVLVKTLPANDAVIVCETFRCHPNWSLIGFPPGSLRFHDNFWPRLRDENFARRRAFDWRTALTLLQQGVIRFATVNLKDFGGLGFKEVWNPLTDP